MADDDRGTHRPIVPRDPELALAGVPRHWLANSAAATGLANAVNLLFPIGERYFVRSVNAFKAVWARDPELAARVKGFYAQEGRHAHAHDELNEVIASQGYDIAPFLRWYAASSARWEKYTPKKLRLAATAAAEHFTALMAEGALSREDPLLDASDPEMAKLLGWHAVEEIEHKSVAFDVLRAVDPSYLLRIAGLALATFQLGRYWYVGARTMWRQDGMSVREAVATLRAMPADKPLVQRVFLRGIREYLRRDFHPDDRDTYPLAREWLEKMGDAVAAA
jgi:predicted metal-dependent hydrolase